MSVRLDLVEVGTRVSYEDMANPRRVGRVMQILDDGLNYRVLWDDARTVDDFAGAVSDLRQPGWSLVADAPGSMFDGDDLIHVVTRLDLIEAGDLVPTCDLVDDEEDFARQAGFVVPVCLSRGVAALVVPNARQEQIGQSVKGRLWDLMCVARQAVGSGAVSFRCRFSRRTYDLKIVVGPDEEGEPVATILLAEED